MYLAKMSRAASASGRSILIFTSKPAGRRMAGSIMSSRLEAPITMTFFEALDAVDLGLSSCGHDRVLDVGGDPRSAGTEDRVHLVEEHDDRGALADAFSRARWNTRRMWRSVSPTYLLSSSGPLMLRKNATGLLVAAAHPLRPAWPASWPPPWRSASCRSRAGRRAGCPSVGAARARGTGRRAGRATRRRRGSASICPCQPADVGVVDVGNLFEDEFLDLALGHPLVGVGRPGLEQQRVAGAQRLLAHDRSARCTTRSSSVCPMTRARSPPSSSLFEHHDLTGSLEPAGRHHVHRLVEHHFLAVVQFRRWRPRVRPPPAACGRRRRCRRCRLR